MGFVIVLIRSKMAEESLILLDKKMLSMDLSALSEFAFHVKVEKSVVEGKGKLGVIRSIRRKIEDSVDALTGDDQIDYVDGLMAHLGPPPLEGMEDKYGQEGLQNKGDLKKLKQELQSQSKWLGHFGVSLSPQCWCTRFGD